MVNRIWSLGIVYCISFFSLHSNSLASSIIIEFTWHSRSSWISISPWFDFEHPQSSLFKPTNWVRFPNVSLTIVSGVCDRRNSQPPRAPFDSVKLSQDIFWSSRDWKRKTRYLVALNFCGFFFHDPQKKSSKLIPAKFSLKKFTPLSNSCHPFRASICYPDVPTWSGRGQLVSSGAQVSFRNKTMKWESNVLNGKLSSAGIRTSLEREQFCTRARYNRDRVWLITGLLCFTSHVVSDLHAVLKKPKMF